jgi:hypothetical protein
MHPLRKLADRDITCLTGGGHHASRIACGFDDFFGRHAIHRLFQSSRFHASYRFSRVPPIEVLARKRAGAMRDSLGAALVEIHFVSYFTYFISKVRLSCN